MEIQYLKGPEIDKVKWNSCVHYAGNGNIFGYMWYLNFIAKEWNALVEGDYESVFPLVWRENFLKSKELYQPSLMRELGIYSIHLLSEARIQSFLDAIPQQYRRIDIAINEQNRPPADSGFSVEEKPNYQLMLSAPYEEIFDNFSTGLARQLQKAEDNDLFVTSSLKPESVAEFFRRHSPKRPGLEKDFHGLQRVMYNVLHRGWGFASGVMDRDKNLYAVNFFVYSHGKVLSLAPVESPEGRALGALPFLFNMLIRTHAGRSLILDFNAKGKNELAEQFGARLNYFYQIRRNSRTLGLF